MLLTTAQELQLRKQYKEEYSQALSEWAKVREILEKAVHTRKIYRNEKMLAECKEQEIILKKALEEKEKQLLDFSILVMKSNFERKILGVE
jgi:hypothetical protein